MWSAFEVTRWPTYRSRASIAIGSKSHNDAGELQHRRSFSGTAAGGMRSNGADARPERHTVAANTGRR